MSTDDKRDGIFIGAACVQCMYNVHSIAQDINRIVCFYILSLLLLVVLPFIIKKKTSLGLFVCKGYMTSKRVYYSVLINQCRHK